MSNAVEAGKAFVEFSVKGLENVSKGMASLKARLLSFGASMARMNGKALAIGAMDKAWQATAASAKTAFRTIGLAGKGTFSLLSNSVKSFVSVATSGFAQLTGVGAFALSGLVAHQFIKDASDMKETVSKFRVVFGQSAETAEAWFSTMAKGLGRSRKETFDFAARVQSVVQPLGVAETEAMQMSKAFTQLAFDMGSFFNMTDEHAMVALMSGLTGETEPMMRLGVNLKQSAVDAELALMGVSGEATEAEKVMARYNIIMKGTAAAQGDIDRTSESFANRLKALQAQWTELSVTIGEKFLPYGEAILAWATAIIEEFTGLANGATGADENLSKLGVGLTDLIAFGNGVISVFHAISGIVKGAIGIVALFLASLSKLAQFVVDNPVTRQFFGIENTGVAGAALGGASDKLLADAQAYFDSAGASFEASTKETIQSTIDNIRSELNTAKTELDAKRKETAREVEKVRADFSKMEAPIQSDKEDEAKKNQRAASATMLESLQKNDIQAYVKFQENQNNQLLQIQQQQLRVQQQQLAALRNPSIAIGVMG